MVTEIFFQSQQQFEQWYELLIEYCIQLNIESFYLKDRKLGKGNYAKVYLGKEVKTNKYVAIKAMKKTRLRESHRNVSAIINEIDSQRCIRHPSICQLFGVFEDSKKVYMIIEYCAGGELFTRILKRKKFPEENAAKFAKNMLEVYLYIHERANVVHRDIKPENILMVSYDNDSFFKLADFGLASKFDPQNPNLTTKCGSPGYVAPEILRNIPYGPKADLFSLGIILYILLVGRQPFYGRNPQEILMQNKHCKINFQAKYWQDISKEAMDLVIQLTDPDPKQRPTAREALNHTWLQRECPEIYDMTPANEIDTPILRKIDPLTPGATPSSKFIAREKIARQLANEGQLKLYDLVESPLLPMIHFETPVTTPGNSRCQSPLAFQQRSSKNQNSYQNSYDTSPVVQETQKQEEAWEQKIQKQSITRQLGAIINESNRAQVILSKSVPKRKTTNVCVFTKIVEEDPNS